MLEGKLHSNQRTFLSEIECETIFAAIYVEARGQRVTGTNAQMLVYGYAESVLQREEIPISEEIRAVKFLIGLDLRNLLLVNALNGVASTG